MARRVTPLQRNLDDPLKLAALTMPSWGLTLFVFAGVQLADRLTGVMQALPPSGNALAWTVVLTALAAMGLAFAERQEDQYFVVAGIRYYASRPWTYVYTGLARGPAQISEEERFVRQARRAPARPVTHARAPVAQLEELGGGV